jgi:hypothetical protein
MFGRRVERDPPTGVTNLDPECVGAPPIPEDEPNIVTEFTQDRIQSLGKLATSAVPALKEL